MGALFFVTGLCCLLRSLPVPAFAFAPSVRMTARNPTSYNRRSSLSTAMATGGFQRSDQSFATTAGQEEGLCSSGGGSSSVRPGAGRGRGRWTTRSKGLRWGLLGTLFSSSTSAPQDGEDYSVDGDDEFDVEKDAAERKLGEATAVGSAAASLASDRSAGVSGSAAVESRSGGAGSKGIPWAALAAVVASQLAIFGFFGWIASSGIREQVISSFTASPTAAALGVAGMVPLLLCGLALDAREDWDWVKKINDATSEATLALFGSERQVAKVTSVAIPLSMLVGFCEECAFRGFIPLVIAAKTGLPTAAVVVLSGVIFGSLHAATFAYFLAATITGMFFHGLLLSTGNIFVPIVAHAVYDAITLVRCHFEVTAPTRKK
ncbi:unnamed protein product [Pylaiella littoralis]